MQQKLIQAERARILQQVRNGDLPADTILPRAAFEDFDEDDFDEDDERKGNYKVVKRVKGEQTSTPTELFSSIEIMSLISVPKKQASKLGLSSESIAAASKIGLPNALELNSLQVTGHLIHEDLML